MYDRGKTQAVAQAAEALRVDEQDEQEQRAFERQLQDAEQEANDDEHLDEHERRVDDELAE